MYKLLTTTSYWPFFSHNTYTLCFLGKLPTSPYMGYNLHLELPPKTPSEEFSHMQIDMYALDTHRPKLDKG